MVDRVGSARAAYVPLTWSFLARLLPPASVIAIEAQLNTKALDSTMGCNALTSKPLVAMAVACGN
jgi:hypothetical protein